LIPRNTYDIEIPQGINGCVYKLVYAGHYLILKCKSLFWSIEKIKKGLDYFLANTAHSRNPSSLGYRLYDFVEKHPGHIFSLHILLVSDEPYQLLRREQEELDKAREDSLCLNVTFDAYTPKYIQSNKRKSSTWVKRGTYLNFLAWKKKNHQNHNDAM
jgi:hypothetical protein